MKEAPALKAVLNRPGKGLYSGEFYRRLLAHRTNFCNPIQASREVQAEARRFRIRYTVSKIRALKWLYERIRCDGRLGFDYDVRGERDAFCMTAEEVMRRKRGLCLEYVFLFLAITNQARLNMERTTTVLVSVTKLDCDIVFPHACSGVFLRDCPKEFRHKRFERDRKFREEILKTAGLEDDEKWHFVLIDFTTRTFGAQHMGIEVEGNTGLVSSYFSNARRYEEAHQLGSNIAVANLVREAYFC